jgi:hypothetical protein
LVALALLVRHTPPRIYDQYNTDQKLDNLLDEFEQGKCTKEEAERDVASQLGNIELNIKKIVAALTGAAGISVTNQDLHRILDLVQALIDTMLATVSRLVECLGLGPVLKSLLHSVFALLCELLLLINKLVSGLLPDLIRALGPLLHTVGHGILAPLLQPIVGLVSGLLGA